MSAATMAEEVAMLRGEVARLRRHYRVQPSDVERLGVTGEQCEAWLRSQGWAVNHDWRGQAPESRKQRRRTTEKHGVEFVYTGSCISGSPWIDLAVREAAEFIVQPEIAILEAMAATVVPHLQEPNESR